MAIPAILDTDIGTDVDDAIALLLACSSPEIRLLAVTTTGGETTGRARLAKKILKTCGKDEVPVFPGMNTRLLPHRTNHLDPYHGHGITTDDIHQHEIEKKHAVEHLLHMPENTVLIAIGPLSNLGASLVLDETATERLRSLYVMGGSFWPPREEYNIRCDPEATRLVVSQDLETNFIGLDVTKRVLLTEEHLQFLRDRNTAITDLAASMLENYRHNRGLKATPMNDPLAVAAVFDESYLQFAEEMVDIDLSNCRVVVGEGWRKRIAREVDQERFMDSLLDRLARLGGSLASK